MEAVDKAPNHTREGSVRIGDPAYRFAMTRNAHSRKTASASAPLFMARSASRADTRAARNSAAENPRAQAACS